MIVKAKILINDDINVWHLRYGHFNYENMINGKVVDGAKIKFEKSSICKGLKGKLMVKLMTVKVRKRSKQNQLWIWCTPIFVVQLKLHLSRYFVTFIVDFSNWFKVIPIKDRTEVFDEQKIHEQ